MEIDAALATLRAGLRAAPAAARDVDFRLVEAAVLMHAEEGLLAMQAASFVDSVGHLGRSTQLLEWSRDAARRLRERAGRDGAPVERIVPRDFYLALAATALAFGQGSAARAYADESLAHAPLDAEAQLVLGCAAEYAAEEKLLLGEAARDLRGEAEAALRKALVLGPALVEARLRLGHVLLAEGRLIEAEPVLLEAEAGAADDRGRYLARLFLGRVAERRERPGDAAVAYRRAIEAWPSTQAARIALAHVLETQADLAAARAQVAATLEASRMEERSADPIWSYPFGPPKLATDALVRVWSLVEP